MNIATSPKNRKQDMRQRIGRWWSTIRHAGRAFWSWSRRPPSDRLVLCIGLAVLFVAVELAFRIWWFQQPEWWRSERWEDVASVVATWWRPATFGLVGVAILTRVHLRRRTARRVSNSRPVRAAPSIARRDWSNVVSSLAAAFTVLVAVAAMLYTNNANRTQNQLNEQGQITQRFATAVEQLGRPGPEGIDVRLGAIYALQRIMRDSVADHYAVVDILAAFVRVHAVPIETTSTSRFPVDIQAAVNVIIRRDRSRERPPIIVDLSRTQLNGVDLSGEIIDNIDFSGADLREANLIHANLNRVNMADVDLRGANMYRLWVRADVGEGSDLSRADLRNACLMNAVLDSAYLMDVQLEGADLQGVDLSSHEEFPSGPLRNVRTDQDTRLPPQATSVDEDAVTAC